MMFKLMKKNSTKAIISIMFLLYLALLTKTILFKYPMVMIMDILKSNEISLSSRIGNSNFIPMRAIIGYLFGSQNYHNGIENILGNIIAFAPLGFLLPLVFSAIKKLKSVALVSFVLSLTFEIIQLLTGIGQFDIDDIVLNMIGAICGYIIFKCMTQLFCKEFVENVKS